MRRVSSAAIRSWVERPWSPGHARTVLEELRACGALQFSPLPTGIYSAVSGTSPEDPSGYQHAWIRDNVYVAFAHLRSGDVSNCVRTMTALASFLRTQLPLVHAVVRGEIDPHHPQSRPHIRFDGYTLQALNQKWSHAQNDALGYFLWMYCALATQGVLAIDTELVVGLIRFLDSIQYWKDEDCGHWEERPKIEASSIGAVVAGLRKAIGLATTYPALCDAFARYDLSLTFIQRLERFGSHALEAILPAECNQPDVRRNRRYDAALLFLIFPLKVVREPMASRILDDVRSHLMGDFGIRRYLGDSYWAADYKKKVPASLRTASVSDHQEDRDAIASPGSEAQWCIFDPVLAAIHESRFREFGSEQDRDLRTFHINRSLQQLVIPDERHPSEFRCAEAYYMEDGFYVPNDHVPLLWTQANLSVALEGISQEYSTTVTETAY